jgi:hypothetical protein
MRMTVALVAIVLMTALAAPAADAAPRDEVVISGVVTVARDQTLGDVVVIDGPVDIAGHVTGDVVVVNGVVTIAGTVDGDVVTVVKRARLLPGARVGGDLHYGEKKPVISPGARVEGEVSHGGWANLGTGVSWAVRLLFWLAVTVSMLALGLALLGFAPRAADAAWRVAQERTGRTVAWAAGLFFGLPVVAIVAMATVFGLPLGLGLLLALLPLAAVGYVAGCWVVGNVVMRGRPGTGRIPTFLVGWGILRLIALIPWVGWLSWFAAGAFGLSALMLAGWYASDASRGTPPAPPPAPPPSPQPAQ